MIERICLFPPQAVTGELSGSGKSLTTKLAWQPPTANAAAAGGYLVERTSWWLGDEPRKEMLTPEPVTGCHFVDTSVVPDKINEYRVYAVHPDFHHILSPPSFPAAIYGFCYLRYTEMVDALQDMAGENPDICRLIDAGPASGERHRIWCMILGTDTSDLPDKPGLLLVGNPHACEIQGVEVCMGILAETIRRYRAGDAAIMRLVESLQVRVVPMYNPHGREAHEKGYCGNTRKTAPARSIPPPVDPLRILHCWQADLGGGIDPNRTFDAAWSCTGDAADPASAVYPGEEPFAAPETRALVEMTRALRPQISIHYHGPCSYPLYTDQWPNGDKAVDTEMIFDVARTFARLSAPTFAAEDPNVSPEPLPVYGTSGWWCYKEWYGVHLTPEGFYEQLVCDPRILPITASEALDELVPHNFNAFLELARRLLGAGIAVHVRSEEGAALVARVEVEGHVDPHCAPQLTDPTHGSYYRILPPGPCTVIVSAPGYADRRLDITLDNDTSTPLDVVLQPRTKGESR